jgi:hypothetical protein
LTLSAAAAASLALAGMAATNAPEETRERRIMKYFMLVDE